MSTVTENAPMVVGLVQDGRRGIIMTGDRLSEEAFDAAYRALYRMQPREEDDPCVTGPEYEAYLDRDDPRIAFDFSINCRQALASSGRLVCDALAGAGVRLEIEEEILIRSPIS